MRDPTANKATPPSCPVRIRRTASTTTIDAPDGYSVEIRPDGTARADAPRKRSWSRWLLALAGLVPVVRDWFRP